MVKTLSLKFFKNVLIPHRVTPNHVEGKELISFFQFDCLPRMKILVSLLLLLASLRHAKRVA